MCRNWLAELTRFAPTLCVSLLAESDRATAVADARPGDVVLASYGLIVSEEDLLTSRRWGTVVFDEAHALKNSTTRRWGSAQALEADAVVALTGTPVENHATELHSLFALLVAGLLGSRAQFERAVGKPLAEGDRGAAQLLRQLVRPFLLRRTKAEVLTELPPRTDVLQLVKPGREHMAFYEAVRKNALEKVAAAQRQGKSAAARARIQILAELTRLRRAAIDPRLVGGEQAPPGGKLEALAYTLAELRDEGRRALVFSQFLEVLDLAALALDEQGVTSLRLDGSMSAAARERVLDDFRDGDPNALLISLKAGGVGMNITSADVVVLLDPWWNPAVEDQAAGRAHRIGQTRPVTVLRIVSQSTIEEKVLALHEKKRQLFDDVVDGADGGGALDLDALTSLLGAAH